MTKLSKKSKIRTRLLAGEDLVGVFVKTPAYQVVEVLGSTDLDFIILDQEHSPFDLNAIDSCLMAGKMADMPTLVRIQQNTATGMLYPLDCGASGVIVPHVATVEKATEIAAGGRYRGGRRGFAGTQRAGGYGTREMNEYIDQADSETIVIAQIEDVEAVENIEDIVKVDNIDCFFLGRMDLTVGYGATAQTDKVVVEAVEHVCKVVRTAGKRLAAYSSPAEKQMLSDLGVTMFTMGSEHSLLLSGANKVAADFSK
ncbi:MAG: aldolase [Kordiimonadaceae bacterium]|nr:aldolase [Kordiimonadaceae bacterium]MBT6031031.1 aldolase [Kordiimonadaceae bacterium]